MADTRLVVCVNERLGYGQKSCGGSGSRALIEQLDGLLKEAGLAIPVTEQVCLGRCEQGIAMRIAPGGRVFYRSQGTGFIQNRAQARVL